MLQFRKEYFVPLWDNIRPPSVNSNITEITESTVSSYLNKSVHNSFHFLMIRSNPLPDEAVRCGKTLQKINSYILVLFKEVFCSVETCRSATDYSTSYAAVIIVFRTEATKETGTIFLFQKQSFAS